MTAEPQKTMLPPRTVFVGGPFLHVYGPDGVVVGPVRELIELVARILSDAGHKILSAHLSEDFGAGKTPTDDEIAIRDYGWSELCDLYVAILPTNAAGELVRTDGTHVELGWAVALRKPVLIIGNAQRRHLYTPIVRALLSITPTRWLDQEEARSMPQKILNAAAELTSGL